MNMQIGIMNSKQDRRIEAPEMKFPNGLAIHRRILLTIIEKTEKN
jgi:hypothetical protein